MVVMNIILLKNKNLDTKSIKITEIYRILPSRYYLAGATKIPTHSENPRRMEIIKLLLLKSNSWDISNFIWVYNILIVFHFFVCFGAFSLKTNDFGCRRRPK